MKKGRKKSGGKYKKSRKKKKYEIRGQNVLVRLGEEKKKEKRIRGGNKKIFSLKARFINVHLPENRSAKKVEIKNVLETPSKKFLARQNILVKGAIVETELGKVKITNRPSQEGVVNGILLKE